jgi:hypothetical protein
MMPDTSDMSAACLHADTIMDTPKLNCEGGIVAVEGPPPAAPHIKPHSYEENAWKYLRKLGTEYSRNVFSDVGIGSRGIVDGDALLLHCLESGLIKPEARDDLEQARFDQMLPVAFLFQSMLAKLAKCRAKLQVVFFDSRLAYWTGFGKVMRLALPGHLEQTLTLADITVYRTATDFTDPLFQQNVRDLPFTYLITNVTDAAFRSPSTETNGGLHGAINAFAAHSQMRCATLVRYSCMFCAKLCSRSVPHSTPTLLCVC